MSLHIITCSTLQHPMGTSTAKSARACTGSRKRGSLPRSSWQKGWKSTATTRAKLHQGYGHMNVVQSPFLLLLTTSGWNASGENMPSTWYKWCRNIICACLKRKRKILLTHHQMGLCRQKGATFDAIVPWGGIKWFQHPSPIVPLDQLHQHVKKMYSAKVQHANLPDDSPPLNKAGNKFIKEVMGVFLYLAWAVDSTMLTVLSALTSKQAAPTEKTMQKFLQFLDYSASQEDAIITYWVSNMRLAIHSNALYLSEPRACCRASGHIFMAGTEDIPINNGGVLDILQIVRAVMSSAAEAKLGALFINIKTMVLMHSRKWDTHKLSPQSEPTFPLLLHYSPTKFCQRR